MSSFSRFADPFLDIPLVPEDFASVSRFCADARSPAATPTPRRPVCSAPSRDSLFAFADHSAEASDQLLFDNI